MQFFGNDIEHRNQAVGCRTAGLFDDHGHRIGLVQQTDAAAYLDVAFVGGIHENAAACQDPVHVGHHGCDPAHVEIPAERSFLAGLHFIEIPFDRREPAPLVRGILLPAEQKE